MNETVRIIIIVDFAVLLLDIITITDLRRFLLDFISGKKSRVYADRVFAAQPAIQKITLSFIRDHLKKNFKAFECYYRIYLAVIYTLVAQYIILLVSNLILGEKSIYVAGLFFVIKIIVCISVRMKVDSNRISEYRKK